MQYLCVSFSSLFSFFWPRRVCIRAYTKHNIRLAMCAVVFVIYISLGHGPHKYTPRLFVGFACSCSLNPIYSIQLSQRVWRAFIFATWLWNDDDFGIGVCHLSYPKWLVFTHSAVGSREPSPSFYSSSSFAVSIVSLTYSLTQTHTHFTEPRSYLSKKKKHTNQSQKNSLLYACLLWLRFWLGVLLFFFFSLRLFCLLVRSYIHCHTITY